MPSKFEFHAPCASGLPLLPGPVRDSGFVLNTFSLSSFY